jgi:hypothetical protein
MSEGILEQQLKLLEQDVSVTVGVKAAGSAKLKKKRAKRAKRKKSEIAEVATEDAKRKRMYEQNVKKLVAASAADVSIDFVKKVGARREPSAIELAAAVS